MGEGAKARSATGWWADRLAPRLTAPPAASNAWLTELTAAARALGATDLVSLLPRKAGVAEFITSVMEDAPFLRTLMLDDPSRLAAILAVDPVRRLAAITVDTAAAWRERSEAELMAHLRHTRQEVALIVALADLGA